MFCDKKVRIYKAGTKTEKIIVRKRKNKPEPSKPLKYNVEILLDKAQKTTVEIKSTWQLSRILAIVIFLFAILIYYFKY